MSKLWLVFALPFLAWAQQSAPPQGGLARIIVTLGHFYGQAAPALTPEELTVRQQSEPVTITNLTRLAGDRAGLELYVLVDQCSNCEPGTKFDDLRRFLESQPATTELGVAYIQDGRLQVAQRPSQDREQVIQALSPPAGSKPSNPFGAVRDLILGWPPDSLRHAVLMITNATDPAGGERLQDPLAEAAIEAAQRAGVIVYAIYHPSADYVSTDSMKIYSGQVQLAHVAYETGGEAYFLGLGPLPSLAPFLSDIADHLANQYLLEFLGQPCAPPGALQEITVRSKNRNVELMVAARAWVPGRSPAGAKRPAAPGKGQ